MEKPTLSLESFTPSSQVEPLPIKSARYAIGIDIGATNLKLVLIDHAGKVYAQLSTPTLRYLEPDKVVQGIIEQGLAFKQHAESYGYIIEGIGFATCNHFELETWTQLNSVNMPALEEFPLYPPLRAAFGSSITMTNDVCAAAIAEHLFGCGRTFKRMLLLAIGTGIATGAVTEEGLIQYNWSSMGNSGHIIVDLTEQTPCTCGARGCLEAVASGPAIRRTALAAIDAGQLSILSKIRLQKGDIEARDVAEAAAAGDEISCGILDRAGYFIGVALSSYLHIFRPDLIVLAGGVSKAGDLLRIPIRRTLDQIASPFYLARLHGIEFSILVPIGAAIGCASTILYPDQFLPLPPSLS